MAVLLSALIMVVAVNCVLGQSKSTILLDKRGKEVQLHSDAHYYEVVNINESGGGTRVTYLMEDSSKVSLYTYSDLNGGRFEGGILEGPYYKWYKNGELEFQAEYQRGKLTGAYKSWYENGQLRYKIGYLDGEKHDSLTAYYETGRLRRIEVYSLGKLTTGHLYNEQGEEIDFFPMEQMPEFKGGEQRMMKWIFQHVNYPRKAYKDNVEGIVIVSFVIEKNGRVDEAEIIRSVHPEIDAEALRVVKLMPSWKPGLQEGKPARVRYTLPLKFSLKK